MTRAGPPSSGPRDRPPDAVAISPDPLLPCAGSVTPGPPGEWASVPGPPLHRVEGARAAGRRARPALLLAP